MKMLGRYSCLAACAGLDVGRLVSCLVPAGLGAAVRRYCCWSGCFGDAAQFFRAPFFWVWFRGYLHINTDI
jgi:hypothetical protein